MAIEENANSGQHDPHGHTEANEVECEALIRPDRALKFFDRIGGISPYRRHPPHDQPARYKHIDRTYPEHDKADSLCFHDNPFV